MILNFKNDSEVIIYALEKIISFARQNQYFFVASCVWWIASVTGLDSGLRKHIDNLVRAREDQGVSSIPRDIARDISVDSNTQKTSVPASNIIDPLRRTRKGRINPLPQTKRLLKTARKLQNRIKQQSILRKNN